MGKFTTKNSAGLIDITAKNNVCHTNFGGIV